MAKQPTTRIFIGRKTPPRPEAKIFFSQRRHVRPSIEGYFTTLTDLDHSPAKGLVDVEGQTRAQVKIGAAQVRVLKRRACGFVALSFFLYVYFQIGRNSDLT